jgi:hypothetical protein
VQEYKIKNATIRIHGTVGREKLENATTSFIKKALKSQKEKK